MNFRSITRNHNTIFWCLILILFQINIFTACTRGLVAAPFLQVDDFCYPFEKEVGQTVTFYIPVQSNDECGGTNLFIDNTQNVDIIRTEDNLIEFRISTDGPWLINYTVACTTANLTDSAFVKGPPSS